MSTPILGYIRHNPDYNQLTYYSGPCHHEYDYPVTPTTTLKELALYTGQNGQAFVFFANLIQREF